LYAIFSGDLPELFRVWTENGIARLGNTDVDSLYQFALHGIETPGGFQTWKPEKGEATRHSWLPAGTAAMIDTYGSLSPQPAASRLFIPLELSTDIQNRVTRAFIKYADKLRKEHSNDPEWQNWFRNFLRTWDKHVLYSAILGEDLIQIVDALTIKYQTNSQEPEQISPFELCKQFNTVNVYEYLSADYEFSAEDTWWRPGFAEAEYDDEGKREVDLTPLAARLGIKKDK
jgi:hypothetical protein